MVNCTQMETADRLALRLFFLSLIAVERGRTDRVSAESHQINTDLMSTLDDIEALPALKWQQAAARVGAVFQRC